MGQGLGAEQLTLYLYEKALKDRFITLVFTADDTPEARFGSRAGEAKRSYIKTLYKFKALAPHLGRILIEAAIKVWEKLTANDGIYEAVAKEGVLDIGRRVWEQVSKTLGAEIPWTKQTALIEPDLTEDLRETFLDWLAQKIYEAVEAENKPNPPRGDVYVLLERLYDTKKLQKYMSWLHVDDNKLVITHGVLTALKRAFGREHEPVLRSLRRFAEATGFTYRTEYVKGKRIKGIAVPRELVESKLLTSDDILNKYEEKIGRLILEGRLEPSEEAVVKYLAERGVAEETARHVYRLLRGEKPLLFSRR